MEYRKDIQGLRALAVIFVFIFHINTAWLPGGFIGVDMFFVISGFLISSIIFKKLDNNKFSFKDFYIKRIKRIVPAYYVVLLLIAVFAIFILIRTDIGAFRKGFFYSVVFLSNNFFSTLDTYFGATNSENPLLHTWTLAVEMQFYLFLPIILLLTKRKWAFKVILLLTVGLFTYGTIEIFNNNKDGMYFSLLARAPEFFIGVLASLMINKVHIKKNTATLISLLGIIILLVSAFLINEKSFFPGVTAVVPCLGTALLIVSPVNPIRTFLSNKILFFIGEISYSLYLFHWPVMAFIRYHYNVSVFSTVQVVGIVCLSFILATLSYYFIETPIRKSKKKYYYSITVALGLCCAVLTVFMIPINNKRNNIPIEYSAPIFGLSSHGERSKVETLGDTLSSRNKVLLIGDSHALCMKKYFDHLGKRNSFSFRTQTNNTYPAIPGISHEEFSENKFYNIYRTIALSVDEEIKNSKIILLQFTGDGTRWLPALENLINNLSEEQHLVLLSDFPYLDKNPIRINKEIVKDDSRPNYYEKIMILPGKEVLDLIEANPRATFLNLSNNRVFDSSPFYSDTLMYYDKGHLNVFGSRVYAENTEKEIMHVLNSLFLELYHEPSI